MSHTSAAALRTTYWVFQIGSKLARSACGTKRNTRAGARWPIAGAARPPAAAKTPAAVLMNLRRSIAGPIRSNRLGNTPEERQRSLRDPADVLAPGIIPQIHAERRIDRLIERDLVQPPRNKLLFIERLGVVPRRDLGFDLGNIRPAEERLVAVGAKQLVGGIETVDSVKGGVKNVPAALTRRRFLRPARDHRAPVERRSVDVDAESRQQVGGDITPGLVVGKILRRHRDDRFARVTAFRQQALGRIEIARAFEDFATFLVVKRRARREVAGQR